MRTIRLTATLDRPGGTLLLCGRCRGELGATRTPEGVQLSPGYLEREGLWRLTRHARRNLKAGRKPELRRPIVENTSIDLGRPNGNIGFFATEPRGATHTPPVLEELPRLIECPWCERHQWLRAETLQLRRR